MTETRTPSSNGRATIVASPTPPLVARRQRSTTEPRTVLAVASLGVFMAFVDATIVNIAFPSIERSFSDASLSSLSWILNAYNIVVAALLVGAGRIADLVGRRRAFRAGLVVFTVASGLCALAPSVLLLVLARILQAIGAAVLVPCSLALVLHAFPEERRAHAVAMWTATAALAAGIGPSLGGVLVSISDWRLAFLVNIPFGLIAYVLAGRRLVESRVPGLRRLPDLAGAAVLAGGIGALTLAIIKGPEWGWGDPRVLAAFVVSVALVTVFVRRCARHRVPLIDLELFGVGDVAAANALTVVGAAGFFAYTLCNVLFLTFVWRYSVLQAGLAITPGPFVVVAIARPASALAARIGLRIVLATGALLWAAGLLWFITRADLQPAYLSVWLPGMILLGLGAGICFPNISSAAVTSAPGERFATATALNSVARQLGAVLGVALLVAIVGTPGPADALAAFHRGWWFAAGCFAAVAVGTLTLGRRARPPVPDVGQLDVAGPALVGPASREAAELTLQAPSGPRPEGVRSSASPAEFLRGVALFADLPDEQLGAIVARAQRLQIGAGEELFAQGDDGDCLYLVRSGRLDAIKTDHEGTRVVASIERGAVVGELAVLADSRRAASVRAVRDCDLLRIDRDDFLTLMHESPSLAIGLVRTLSAQIQNGTRAARRPLPTTVALVPLNHGLPLQEIARAIGAELSAHGSVGHLDHTGTALEDDDLLAAFAPIVEAAEAAHDHVLLTAGSPHRFDGWTRFCLARADRVLLVTRGGQVPPWLAGHPGLRGSELVAYGVPERAGALAGWVAALDPSTVHRIDPGDGLADTAALTARRLAGRSVGVVLAGGGARAFAHLGMLEELIGAGLQIDRVGGVSMGGFLGAQLAAGRAIEEIDACCYDEWVRASPFNDYTVPRHGLIRGEKGLAMLRRVFGDLDVETLPRSFYCTSADLRTSETVIHRTGPVVEAVAATICLPIIGTPRLHDGRALIDGSLVDNLPVAPMAISGEGPVVALDVKPRASSGGTHRRGYVRPPRSRRPLPGCFNLRPPTRPAPTAMPTW